ncbi:Ig-like domain-containing protein [Streptomyces sp. NPDC001380]|uniref:L,D-transpeptidase n=1 Tax=Streptomyces sp. NPDC001380 TaxID=3364566 RepID=UPI00368B1D33
MHPGSTARGGRTALAAVGGVLLVLAALAGCRPADPVHPSSDGAVAATPAPPRVSRAAVTVVPADGASDVAPTGSVRVTAERGRLTSVRLADDGGHPVPGHLEPGGAAWLPDAPLALSTRYTVDATARDAEGLEAARHAVFTTLVPKHTAVAFFTPEAGSTVGVGMPVSLRFTRPIADRAAVERAVRVTADPPVPVRLHWFDGTRLDFRPKYFWKPGTRVLLSLRLRDQRVAPGVYGVQRKDVRFTVGRSQVSTVDVRARTMTVRRDGGVLRTLPISAGSPQHPTYNGYLVVSEKFAVTRMNSRTVGLGSEYDIPDVPHAMRLTGSGTFVHGNYWAPRSVFGAENTSHGCVGLADTKGGGADTPAGWFFAHSLIGDVVRVEGSDDRTVDPANGLNGWNLPWSQWSPQPR